MDIRLNVEIQTYILRATPGATLWDAKRDAQYFANMKQTPVVMIHKDREFQFNPQKEEK